VTAFSDIGIQEITGGKKAFVNFTSELSWTSPAYALQRYPDRGAPGGRPPTEQVLAACRKLKRRGYLIALDDFIYSEELEPLISLADIIKIDFMVCSTEEIKKSVAKVMSGRRKILLAEKIETYDRARNRKGAGLQPVSGVFLLQAGHRQRQMHRDAPDQQAAAHQVHRRS
jgi:EAL and modified HD-GYP domain-containing signal transduction protein